VARGDLLRGGDGVAVLFVVGAVAVAVLEVDAEVLDRLAAQLLAHALEHLRRELAPNAQRFGKRRGVGRVGLERLHRDLAELVRRLCSEQVRSAVDGVHRLARAAVARVMAPEPRLRAVDAIEGLRELLIRDRGADRHARCVDQLPR